MLLPNNIHPELSIYYNGTIIIQELKEQNNQQIMELYEKTRARKEMTFSVYLLCLDWLYLIEVAEIKESGQIELCI